MAAVPDASGPAGTPSTVPAAAAAADGSGVADPLGPEPANDPVGGAQRPGLFGRLLRAGATSIMATVLSHGSYVALLGFAHANATLASTIAFLVGALFNYFVGRRFTWGRKHRPHPIKETLPYVAVIAAGGAVSIGVATLVQHMIAPMGLTNTERTIVLEIANIASYGVVFIFKFTLLDRFVFRGR
ncbi:MAG TPA: GtrA family protein [Microlunatus sp.]